MKIKITKSLSWVCLTLSLVSCTEHREESEVIDQLIAEQNRLMETYMLNTHSPDAVAAIAMKHALPKALVDQLYAQNDPGRTWREFVNIYNATNIQQLRESEARLYTSPVGEQVAGFSAKYEVPEEKVAAALFDVLLFAELKNATSDD